MFEAELTERFKKIFEVKKVSFDDPADKVKGSELVAPEQGCIFVNVTSARSQIKDKNERAKVTGVASLFAPRASIPFGFFAKQIKKASVADPDLTKDFYFYELEENKGRIGNVVERTFSFIFFYSGQFDPDMGTLSSIEFHVQEES